MTLEELGALLGERREALGLSKADVAERLKYTESRIGDVERGDLSSMPHKAYAKGFLRTYARMLGLSPDEGEIAEALKALSPGEEIKPLEPDRTARPRRDTRWVGIVLSLGIFGLICLGLWRLGLVDFVRDTARDMQTASPMQSKDPLENMPKAPAPAPAPAAQKPAEPAPAPAAGRPANPNMPASAAKPASPDYPNMPAASGTPASPGMPARTGAAPMHSPAQINPSMPAGAGSSTSAGSPTSPASPSMPANPNLAEPAPVRQPLQGTVPAGSPWGTLQGNATL
ncbi:MAG: helix-turn-helix domain-containing protein, partial [Desulfovibrio sp.]|nr:helix-turn-helix domain-containing protein [Desulfovibrio sp.]